MDIVSLIIYFVTSCIAVYVKVDLIMILINKAYLNKTKKFFISILLLSVYVFLSYLVTDHAIKVIIEFLLLIVVCWFIMDFSKEWLNKIIFMAFVIWVGMLLIDIILSFIWIYILNFGMSIVNKNPIIKFCITLISCFMLTLVFIPKRIREFLLKVVILMNQFRKTYYILVIVSLSVLMFSISVYLCLFNYNVGLILVTLFIMILIYTIVVILTINQFNQKNKIQSEYDILLKNLSEYENLLDVQRVLNHENKNQLLVIKGMIDKKERNISEYIESIIDTQYKDNDTVIMKTNRIPSGGLRGLIYYKILTMKDKNIQYSLEVDRSLNELNFDSIPVKTNQELCKIVGVFLDNAIQAVSNLKKKTINVYLGYEKDCLIIEISNNYSGTIDLDKIDNKGYTTKGSGHGYGLSLVKSILKNNDSFINDRKVNRRIFSQIIKLKIK